MNKHLPMTLAANALLFASALVAGEAMVPLHPAVPVEALSGAPEHISISLFDTPDDSSPLLIRHFSPDEWKASRNLDQGLPESGDIRFRMQLYTADEDGIQPGDTLWAEASMDGQPVGDRFEVQAIAPPPITKFTIEGEIETKGITGGIRFPDGSFQRKAANAVVPGTGLEASSAGGNTTLGVKIPLGLSADYASGTILTIENTGLSGQAIQARGFIGGNFTNNQNKSSAGLAVDDIGVTGSGDAAGGIFSAGDGQPDVVLAGRSDSAPGDDGVLASDPARPDSDLLIQTNDWLAIQLDADNSGNPTAGFSVERNGAKLFQMDKDGNLTYGGPGLSAFPRPAYDSGWVAVAKGANVTWNHNLGGNVDNYVVDMQCKGGPFGVHINNMNIGQFIYDVGTGFTIEGAYYWNLDGSKIELDRAFSDTSCSEIRIRIWKYN